MSDVRVTRDERKALVAAEHGSISGCSCDAICAAVEAILSTRLAAIATLADEWMSIPDYTASGYDQGRVDQRHDMVTELLERLEPK